MNPASITAITNPFPGLRPFREEEEHLFFGRELQVDVMVDKLAQRRFLAVVGSSGSGKSSLVNCGLRPALHQGRMTSAGTSWRMAQFRPGNNPLAALAQALAEDGVLFRNFEERGLPLVEIIDTTLRMSKRGLIDIYEQAGFAKDVNLLVVVDQFEELLRYRQLTDGPQPGDLWTNGHGFSEEATAFVKLLLEQQQQKDCPIFVVLTMRSDFLGDCTQYAGLAEAINAGLYLVPRLTPEERRDAIVNPIRVQGAEIEPVLVTRLVNDVGDNPDQLSILQHALNRTWANWQQEGGKDPLALRHYEAIGTMAGALDAHAEESYAELASTGMEPSLRQRICEKLFQALTDKATDGRGVRRPTTLANLCALTEAMETEVVEVIELFRQPSRSFLMPPAGENLTAEKVIDISHESLMRVWERLKRWVEQEAEAAQTYRRLAESASLNARGEASTLRDPELTIYQNWQQKRQPNKAWAERYAAGFDSAMEFLQRSGAERDAELADIKAACEELREHPALRDPKTAAEKEASATCRSRGYLK
jgi:energy-coupling factor transporter ATP-binding protein EcfA2